jgi:cystathionine beta-lyase/cystathionine gamma-synthase
MKKPTRVQHPQWVELPSGNRPLIAPVYQSVKFESADVAATIKAAAGESGFFYSRVSNPTNRQLELLLAELQGRSDCVVTASGVNALAEALISLVKSGDHILCFLETYHPTRVMIKRLLARFGVTHTMLSIEDDAGIERVLKTQPTRLVVFESPTNPVTKIADIARITAAARAYGALTLMDNTFAGFHQHGEYDVDVFVHSLTKYAAGTGDMMGGAIIANTDVLKIMRPDIGLFGAMLDQQIAHRLLQGLKTYFLRYREQTARAQYVAEYLSQHPAVARVHYPGLKTHPRHALAQRQMREFGTIVSFELREDAEFGRRWAEKLEYFAISASLGSTESLVVPPQMMQGRDFTPEERQRAGITAASVRLSIGLEDPDDLLADLAQAFEHAAATARAAGP